MIGEGLRWFLTGGGARDLAFGAAQDAPIASVDRLRGATLRATDQGRGAGPAPFATGGDGSSLMSQDGRTVGWRLGAQAAGDFATAAGRDSR